MNVQASGSSETGSPSGQPTIIVNMPRPPGLFQSWAARLMGSLLMCSLFLNLVLLAGSAQPETGQSEKFVTGSATATDRIAIIDIEGTIMPPFTAQWIEQVERARDDDHVRGVILSIDSPGGLVADSHQIYHKLKQLSAKKPVYVSMKRMAASGGVYVAMGAGEAGKIFAEPTTWTGSIGVIIPRYDLSGLAGKFGVASDPLTTGPFKDAMNPLRPMTEPERALWTTIMNDSFDRFVKIVDEGRKPLDEKVIRDRLATGQVFTATQALENGLIDGIQFEEEVITTLQTDLGLSAVRVVRYQRPPTLVDVLLGEVSAARPAPELTWRKALEATVPQALYYCSWLPPL